MNQKISFTVVGIIIIVLAVIVGCGILAYQYWWLPREKADITPKSTDNNISNNSNNADTNEGNNLSKNAENNNSPVSVKDCGMAGAGILNGMKDPKDDATIDCLGEAASACTPAVGLIPEAYRGNIKFEVIITKNICSFRITLGPEEFITESFQKWAANKFVECSKQNLVKLVESEGGKIDESLKISWVGSSIFTMLAPLSSEDNIGPLKDYGCSGTMLE